MLTTPALHELVNLAAGNEWRLVLVGDPRQLQGVGRGGLLAELCANGRVEQLDRPHLFTHAWEAAASLQLRCGDPSAFDAYEAHGRIIPSSLDDHLARMADAWITGHVEGRPVALVASTNDHVDTVNRAVQQARLSAGHLDAEAATRIAGGDHAHVGDVVATRRNDRHLITTTGETVRNRELWTVTATNTDGSLTVSHHGGHGHVTLPTDYVRERVRLGYDATEHGWQSDTVTTSIALVSSATTRRGVYVAATRASERNELCVITDSNELAEARDILDAIVALDLADTPGVTQRRALAQRERQHELATPALATPRCVIPDWFMPLLQEARSDLAAAKDRPAARAAQRQRLHDAAVAADRNASDVAIATAPDRDAYALAAARAEGARRQHAAAQRRLDAARRRGRRRARHDVEVAERRLERADAYLERTRQRTEPSLARYRWAHIERREAHDDLRYRDTADVLDAMQHPIDLHRRRVSALATWQTWANGGRVHVDDLREAVETLQSMPGHNHASMNALAGSVREWAHHQRVDLGVCPGPEPAIRPARLELQW